MIVITNKSNGNQVMIFQDDKEKMEKVAKLFASRDTQKQFAIMVY